MLLVVLTKTSLKGKENAFPRKSLICEMKSEVQQIVMPKRTTTAEAGDHVFVRSMAGTTHLHRSQRRFMDEEMRHSRHDVSIEETRGLAQVYMSSDPYTSSRLLITDESGGVWRYEDDSRLTKLIKGADRSSTNRKAKWCQTFYGSSDFEVIRASKSHLELLDSRHRNRQPVMLWDRQAFAENTIYAVKDSQGTSKGVHVIVTREHLLWLDEKMPGRPLLATKHYLEEPLGVGLMGFELLNCGSVPRFSTSTDFP